VCANCIPKTAFKHLLTTGSKRLYTYLGIDEVVLRSRPRSQQITIVGRPAGRIRARGHNAQEQGEVLFSILKSSCNRIAGIQGALRTAQIAKVRPANTEVGDPYVASPGAPTESTRGFRPRSVGFRQFRQVPYWACQE
jgi:hypothetical protein